MMPPQSMTGYGRGTSGNFKVEVRSSNHKNIDISINIPYYLFSQEPGIKKTVRKMFHRGRIEIFIPRQELDNIKLKVNKSLAREYYSAIKSLQVELSLSGCIDIDLIASQKDIFMFDEPELDLKGLYEALDVALEELSASRIEEGKNLVHDISARIAIIAELISDIENKRHEFAVSAKEKLSARLREFLEEIQVDETRLIQETAILIEKTDITEELVRMKSHIKQFTNELHSHDSIGKKLDFIIQELRREINTIGSKAQNYEIANTVVEVKHELEKIREQVQNLQ